MFRLSITSFVFCFLSIHAIGNGIVQDLSKEADTINFAKTIEYEVTEITQKAFGSSKIYYTASSKSEIRTNDLGPNNKRIIKEKIVYRKRKPVLNQSESSSKSEYSDLLNKKKLDPIAIESVTKINDLALDTLKSNNALTAKKTVIIKPLETYERMVEDGFQTVEILEILANQSFYNKNYKKAAKYFEKLFPIMGVVNEENKMKYQECLKNIKLETQLVKNHTRNRISSRKRQ